MTTTEPGAPQQRGPRREPHPFEDCAERALGLPCRRCSLHERWLEGRFARASSNRWDSWTEPEMRRLEQLAGTLSIAEIAETLTREFVPRSYWSVAGQAMAMGISLGRRESAWTLRRIAGLFGTDTDIVRRHWLECSPPLLPHRVERSGSRHPKRGVYVVEEADLESFVRQHVWAYDVERMRLPRHRLTELARAAQRRDPWLYVEAAADYLGAAPSVVRRWCWRGLIPSRRRHVGRFGGAHGAVVIPASALPDSREALAEARRRSREFLTASMQAGKRRSLQEQAARAAARDDVGVPA